MLNWENNNEHNLIKPAVRQNDILTMPEIGTGAFTLVRENVKSKLRFIRNDYEQDALSIHQELLKRGWNLPKILEIEEIDGKRFTYVEWVEGKTFWELYHENALTDEDFYKLGEWAGKLNNEVINDKNVSVLNYFHKNCFKDKNGNVSVIDLNKLYYTDFPEAFIEKYVITEDIVTFPQREAFLRGYRNHREYSMQNVIKWHFENVCDKEQDILLDGKVFIQGKRNTLKRIEFMDLPKDMTGFNVLDIGYSGGMFALECAKRGAKYVYAVDSVHTNIGTRHHRLSDMGKLIAYYHGFDGRDLHFKHVDIDSNWFINEHIPRMVSEKGKFDIIFCFNALHKIDETRIDAFMTMLSKSGKCLMYEGGLGQDKDKVEGWLKLQTDYPFRRYLGNASSHDGKANYAMYNCGFTKKKHMTEVSLDMLKEHFGDKEITGIEIGVLGGSWTNYVLTHLPNITHLTCIDPWKHFEDELYERSHAQEIHNANYDSYMNKMKQWPGRVTTLKMESAEAVQHIKEPVDFVFIDGCHDKAFITTDILNYLPLIKTGGLIAGHDYGLAQGVTETIDKFFPNAKKGDDFVWWVTKTNVEVLNG